jgi:PAS domain S-box-containing protein
MSLQSNSVLSIFTILETAKFQLLERWLSSQDVKKILNHHDIEAHFFSKNFGLEIIIHTLDLVQNNNEIGNCPALKAILHFFERKKIPVEDIFTICVNLKNTLIGYLLEKKLLEQDIFYELSRLLDHNFMDVMQNYRDLYDDAKSNTATIQNNERDLQSIESNNPVEEWIFLLQNVKESVLTLWLKNSYTNLLFQKYGIDEWYFREHYGYPLYNRLVENVDGNNTSEPLSFLHTLIDYLNNRNVTPSDLYTLFSVYRNSLITALTSLKNSFTPLHKTVQEYLDKEYIEIVNLYNKSIFGEKSDFRGQLAIFHQYQQMIDKSALVSKGNLDGIITYVNTQFCSVSGYKPEELLGKPHNIIRHPEMPTEIFRELWETIQAKKIFKAIMKNRKKTGETYYVDTTIVPILNEHNDIIEYVSMRYDVTKLVEAVEEANKAKRIRDEFLANMSHEIRTPLNGIIGFVDILLHQNSDKKIQHHLEIIHTSAQMLLRIVNDVLELSKLQSGKFTIESLPFDPIEEISTVASLFSFKAYEKSLSYAVYIDPNIPRCLHGDGGRMKQILSNFLSNAIKFTPEKGVIKMKAVYEKNQLKVLIQDNGIGISSEQQEKIFLAFEQADASITRKYGGTGLGLSISTELLSMMGGKLIFKSIENKGSTFGFELPYLLCHKTSNDLNLQERFTSLRAGIVHEPKKDSITTLIEKYLHDYHLKSVKKITEIKNDDNFDLIFCPSSMLKQVLERRTDTPIILIENLFSGDNTEDKIFGKLSSPFLPYDIEKLLSEIKMR